MPDTGPACSHHTHTRPWHSPAVTGGGVGWPGQSRGEGALKECHEEVAAQLGRGRCGWCWIRCTCLGTHSSWQNEISKEAWVSPAEAPIRSLSPTWPRATSPQQSPWVSVNILCLSSTQGWAMELWHVVVSSLTLPGAPSVPGFCRAAEPSWQPGGLGRNPTLPFPCPWERTCSAQGMELTQQNRPGVLLFISNSVIWLPITKLLDIPHHSQISHTGRNETPIN